MLRPTHRYWLSSVCTIKFGNRLKRYFYKMNETENRAEEDASWSNFRLTIQQVLFMSGYSDVSLTNTSRFMMQRPCGSLRSHSTVWWSSIPLSLYVSALHSIQQHLSTSVIWQSGVWATCWSCPPSCAPPRWGRLGMFSSGTWPSLTSACVWWPCPLLWWGKHQSFSVTI